MRLITLLVVSILSFPALADLNLYTDRSTAVLQKVADDFKAQTGVNVKITELPYATLKGLLQQEGSTSPADVIYTKDLIYLGELAQEGFFQKTPSQVTSKVLPFMHDPNNLWTAITYRVRSLVYEASIDVSSINTFEDLANTDLAGTFCVRSSNSYGVALVASLVKTYGYDEAWSIVKGWVANRKEDKFYSDDTSVIKAIAEGIPAQDGSGPACLLGLSNSYYLGKYLLQQPNAAVKMKFLKQGKKGYHTNGTGAGIAKNSQQPDLASKFIDLLLSKNTQVYLTNEFQEFPAATGVVPTNKLANQMPKSNELSDVNWSDIAADSAEAELIMIDSNYK